jgi:PilZ domain-containing protein
VSVETLDVERPAIEKRRAPRFPTKTPSEIRIQARQGDVTGFLVDMSEDGMGLATVGADLQVGETVTVELPKTGEQGTVRLKAIVRYSRGVRFGLEFIDDSKV